MVALSVQIEIAGGLNWPRWKRLVREVDHLGYSGSLEIIVAFTYLADHSQRLEFGSLVSPVSFRHPVWLARQAMALDDLSGGRMVLGLGAGWVEDEHVRFGYDFADNKSRLDRLAEGAEVITRLCRDAQPVTFDGRFYRLREA